MATVTKMKAAINNKNLPILTPDGELTNYYYGNFYNKVEELGYALSADEKTAVKNFIDSAINNGYIDYIRYMLPFIGDSEHPDAGLVPLIDNVDDYKMREYLGSEDYSTNFFEFDQVTGKILSVHNNRNNGDFIKTPVNYSLERGLSCMFTGKYIQPSTGGTYIVLTPVVDDEGVSKYIRLRYSTFSVIPKISFMNSGDDVYSNFTVVDNTIEEAISNSYNVNYGICFNKNSEGQMYRWSSVEMPGVKTIGNYSTTALFSWNDLDYGKFEVGRNLAYTYLKLLVFVNPEAPNNLKGQLSSDMLTLVTALGR